MLEAVAVAVDGSDAGYRALDEALDMLGGRGRVLMIDVKDVVAFVQPVAPSTYGGSTMASLETLLEQWDENAAQVSATALKRVAETQATAQWKVVTVQDGEVHAAQAFLDAALEGKVQALVVGRHQGSSVIEGLFGSFPRWLVTHASLPVVIVPPPLTGK